MTLKGTKGSENAPDIPIPFENFTKKDGIGELLGSDARLALIAEDILAGRIVFVTEQGVVKFAQVEGRYQVQGVADSGLLKGLKNVDFQTLDPVSASEPSSAADDPLVSSQSLLPIWAAARQYWLDAGAAPAALAGATIELAGLPAGVVAQTAGRTITLDPRAAGWGWYVDPTPRDNGEFSPASAANEFQTTAGSPAADKIDLLSVLIHELGHVLGLTHSIDGHDEMSATVTPGWRRLPDLDADQPLARVVTTGTDSLRSLTVVAPPQFDTAANPILTNPGFANPSSGTEPATAWSTTGDVTFAPGAATLKETPTSQTRLSQAFVLGPDDRYLTFTLSAIALDDVDNAPDDAFEVALIDANTGLSLLGGTGLTHNDAFLNLQADGSETKSSGVTTIRNPDGSRSVLVDLAGVHANAPAGTVVNLSFDLIGFGRGTAAVSSRVTVKDLHLGLPQEGPQARDDSATTAEDTPIDLDVAANDTVTGPAHSPSTPILVSGPAHGRVELTAQGRLRYTPAADWSGEDQFTYRLANDSGESNIATVTLTVTPVNDAPLLADQNLSGLEDTPLAGSLLTTASDTEAAPLTATLISGPAHGTLVVNPDFSFTYTLDANRNGSDRFSYRVSDGELDSPLATVHLTVAPVNDAPVIAPQRVTVDEDTPVPVDLLAAASDVDGDTLTVTLTTTPQHGRFTQNADGTWTYVPTADWNGTDFVDYDISDGSDGSTSVPTRLTLTVTPVNDAPVLADQDLSGFEDTPLAGSLLTTASDTEAAPLTATLISGPAHGTLVVNPDFSFTYTLDANRNGSDRFSYRVSDGELDSPLATVHLTVAPVNDAPVIAPQRVTVDEDTPVPVDLLAAASDVDGDTLTVTLTTTPQHGRFTQNADGTWTYVPTTDWNGQDSASFDLSDGTLSTSAQIEFTVTPVNDAPVLTDQDLSGFEDTPLAGSLLATASDPDSPTLSARLISRPQHGKLAVAADGSFTYTPDANWNGSDTFTYLVNDGEADSTVAEVQITLVPVNDAPVLSPIAATLLEDGSVTLDLLAQASDIDGDALIITVVQPAHGDLQQNPDRTWTYRPKADTHGSDDFTVSASDGKLSTQSLVRLTITAVNDAPVARDDHATVGEDGRITLALLSNDSDLEGDPLNLTLASPPAHGTLTENADHSFTYLPAGDWSGEDHFTYRLNDGQLDSELATVRITVSPQADAPTLVLSEQPGQTREIFRTGWESVVNRNRTSTLVQSRELEGWTLITRPDRSAGGANGFEIWSTGDQMMDANHTLRRVSAMPGDGNNWLELNNAGGDQHQTLGIERRIDTVAGATYTLSLDLAGRLGYSADTTRISVTLDGVQIATDASLSPANALNWQTRTTTFTGRGGTQTLRIASDARQIDRNGRGMMLDDIVLSETLPANTGREDSPIRLSAISAALRDTDGSETLTLSLEDLPVGSVLSDGSKRFTATADHSTVELTGWTLGQLSLTPAKDYHGRFTLQVVAIATEQANGTQARSQASLTVTVLPVNDAPTARDASYTVKQAGQIDLDLSMLIGDIDGDTLTLTLSSPCHGRLIKNPDGSYRYLPQRGFTGTERIAYTVSDGRLSSSAVLTLRVVPDEDEHCHLARPEGPERSERPERPQPAHGRAHPEDAPLQPTPSPQRPSVGTPAIDWNGRAPDWKLAIVRNWVADYFTTPKNTPRTLAEITGLVVKVER